MRKVLATVLLVTIAKPAWAEEVAPTNIPALPNVSNGVEMAPPTPIIPQRPAVIMRRDYGEVLRIEQERELVIRRKEYEDALKAEQKRRDDEQDAEEERKHLELQALGYSEMDVSDLQLNGRDLIGKKVAVYGYIFVTSHNRAKITTNSDDLVGISVDISSGDVDTRKYLLENCSSLSVDCQMQLRTTVVDGEPTLKLN